MKYRNDPLAILPEEVWTSIIAESATQSHLSGQAILSQDTLLDLMLVSRLWGVKISSNAVLWVDILLEDKYDAAAKAALALHYSKEAPIALYMDEPTGWWDTLRERLVANRGRVNKVYISTSSSSFSAPIIEHISPLSNLTTLAYGGMTHATHEDSFLCLFESPIKWLDNLWLDKDMLRRRSTRELRSMCISDDLDEVMDLIGGSECLREVVFNSKLSTAARRGREMQTQYKKLPWTSLTFTGWPTEFGFIAAIIGRLSSLVKLVIGISQNEFYTIIPLMYQLESLQSLVLGFPGQWADFRCPVVRQPADSVRSLCIDFTSWKTMEIGERLEDTLFQCFPNIRLLNVYAITISAIFIYASNSGFKYIQNLVLNSWATGSITEEGIAEPLGEAVERVSYRAAGFYLHLLIPSHCPLVKHLGIRSLTNTEMELSSFNWPELRTLVTNFRVELSWERPFQYLSSISIDTFTPMLPGDVYSAPARTATIVCRDLALYPECCPVLKKLRLEACPEWDILLILIEGRNAPVKPGISPIETLEIPTRCPPLLVECFRGVMKGERTRYRYHGLSLAGNYQITEDPSM